MSDAQTGDRLVHGAYRALPDAVSDRLFTLTLSLAAEVWTVRDRLRLVEAALDAKGLALDDALAQLSGSPEDVESMRVDRAEFLDRLFASLTGAPKPGDASHSRPQ